MTRTNRNRSIPPEPAKKSWIKDKSQIFEYTLTAAQYAQRVEGRHRPLTDRPIGANTAPKRETDAIASAAFTDPEDHTETIAAIIKQRKQRQTKCGTIHGWYSHHDRNEPACAACRNARRTHRTP